MKKLILTMAALSLGVGLLGCVSAASGQSVPAAGTDSPQILETPQGASVEVGAASTSAPTRSGDAFTVLSGGITDGIIGDAYGARAEQKARGIPNRSFPLTIQNAPEGTACFALTMIDPDGANWVHWLAANLPAQDLAENASVDEADAFLQGRNGFGFTGYGGPTPPSGTHTYVITVYALSEPLALENGFSLKQFNQAIEGKVLGAATLKGDYAH